MIDLYMADMKWHNSDVICTPESVSKCMMDKGQNVWCCWWVDEICAQTSTKHIWYIFHWAPPYTCDHRYFYQCFWMTQWCTLGRTWGKRQAEGGTRHGARFLPKPLGWTFNKPCIWMCNLNYGVSNWGEYFQSWLHTNMSRSWTFATQVQMNGLCSLA